MHIHVSAHLTILFNNREELRKNAKGEPDRDGEEKRCPEHDWNRINCSEKAKIKNSSTI